MRTKTLLLTAALSAAGIATAKAQVYSVNAVGYVNTALVKGFNLISNPLDNKATDGNTVKNLFSALPGGAQVFVFNGTKYDTASVDEFTGELGGPAATDVITPGNGVFVRVDAPITITFVGEVPAGQNLQNPIPKGFSIKASQVPQAGKITTDLNYQGDDGDNIFSFDAATQKYTSASFSFGSWDPAEPTLQVGQAVFIRTDAANKVWSRSFDISK
jgi:hypothetical protein